jgi:uncharacterized protein YdiU (UPF0061 family)
MKFNFQKHYQNLPTEFYSSETAESHKNPQVILFNDSLAGFLNIFNQNQDFESLSATDQQSLAQILSGAKVLPGSDPIAMAYSGHQFGHFTMLGDGRAILLGEILGSNNKLYDIHLKGSGPTEYSRRGDGFATVGPMVREFLVSEYMNAIGIPTTRSLGVLSTNHIVHRDGPKPGAILVRVSESHIRVGTFQYAAQFGVSDHKLVKSLADFTIERHFPNLTTDQQKYFKFFKTVVGLQAELIAKWMGVGFIHGVMNSDNMLICGATIDYGPCAFMDEFDPNAVFSSIDAQGRYAYSNQPIIAQWNLARFAESILPLLDSDMDKAVSMAEDVLGYYLEAFQEKLSQEYGDKFGLSFFGPKEHQMAEKFFECLKNNNLDYTQSFRSLADEVYIAALDPFYPLWADRIQDQQLKKSEVLKRMKAKNPVVIPRNHVVDSVLRQAESGNYNPAKSLFQDLINPFSQPKNQELLQLPNSTNRVTKTFCGT